MASLRCMCALNAQTRPIAPKAVAPREPIAKRIASAGMAVATSLLLTASPSFASVPETSQPGSNVGYLSNEEVVERREAMHFVRSFDGKVALQSKDRKLWDVKLDLRSPGTVLLRAPDGVVHYLAFSTLQQVDLSDDEVVGAIAFSEWEKGAQPVQAEEGRSVRKLELTREGFYELMSVVDPSLAPSPQ
uniref:Uncharacterized protein n=1 Tax=Chlamydomonas leiostraca TaxID=1034604 RepID=A0A7S0RJR6_9CHLO